jgi:hypothetical protein
MQDAMQSYVREKAIARHELFLNILEKIKKFYNKLIINKIKIKLNINKKSS